MITYINILLICITILPKVSIISIGGNSAGIRIEDIIIAIYVLLGFMNEAKKGEISFKSIKVQKVVKLFGLYISVCIIGTLYGVFKDWITPILAILYLVRKVEYFCLLIIGYEYMSKIKDINKVLKKVNLLVYIHFGFTILQSLRNNGVI